MSTLQSTVSAISNAESNITNTTSAESAESAESARSTESTASVVMADHFEFLPIITAALMKLAGDPTAQPHPHRHPASLDADAPEMAAFRKAVSKPELSTNQPALITSPTSDQIDSARAKVRSGKLYYESSLVPLGLGNDDSLATLESQRVECEAELRDRRAQLLRYRRLPIFTQSPPQQQEQQQAIPSLDK
ncbi:hypothetical protein HK100_001692 [Physocladia obscura]|uniref:Uncharacterized protein n=1 Tax=Physocladia obscura TaxID=109957 RepID=A0AAD5XBM3_9FUNG|nr:hypothetical protein HK100_001692 [Physocladia obscura]